MSISLGSSGGAVPATGRQWPRWCGAILVTVLALGSYACADDADLDEGGERAPGSSLLADAVFVEAGDEGEFDDLPGVEAFEGLSEPQRVAVVARANRTRCTCGCPRHSVNHCLHQQEACDVALHAAAGYVDDAFAFERLGGAAVGGDETVAPASPSDASGDDETADKEDAETAEDPTEDKTEEETP